MRCRRSKRSRRRRTRWRSSSPAHRADATPRRARFSGRANRFGLETWTPESVNLPESQARLAALGADLLVVCDYGEILRPETLATTRLGGINLHGSLLPKYRGAAPVQWAILHGDTETGNSVIQMTPGLDAGPCLAQERTPIDPDEDAATLEARLAALGAKLVLRVVDELAAGTAKPVEQNRGRGVESAAAHEGARRDRLVALGDRDQEPGPRGPTLAAGVHVLASQRRRAGATQHRPRATGGLRRARFSERASCVDASNRLLVSTGDGALEILEVQPAGKRAMSAADFLRGNRVVGRRPLLGPAVKSPSRGPRAARYHRRARHGGFAMGWIDRWDIVLALVAGVRRA